MQIAPSFEQKNQRVPSKEISSKLERFIASMEETGRELESIRGGAELLDENFKGSSSDRCQFEEHFVRMVTDRLSQLLTPRFAASQELLEGVSREEMATAVTHFTKHVGRHFREAPFVNRAYVKPRGYAGDYEMMNHIYRNKAEGKTLFSRCLNYYTVNLPFSVAVRNRAILLRDKMVAKIQNLAPGQTLNILSVACGPAKEICDLVAIPGLDLSRVKFFLLDQDEEALAYATTQVNAAATNRGITVNLEGIPTNVINYVRSRTPEKFAFIYSAGLFDYFSDNIAKLTAKRLFQKLAAGGELFIGNFKSIPETRMHIELIAEWFLIYRTQEELTALFNEITPHLSVVSEPREINLFVTMLKDQEPLTH